MAAVVHNSNSKMHRKKDVSNLVTAKCSTRNWSSKRGLADN